MKEIFLAGGCFWGVQRYYDQITGVIGTQAGYANGRTVGPTYEDVCRGDSDFAETVWVRYDENKISLEDILALFFRIIDPTARDRQGNDVGTQYRTGVYYVDPADEFKIRSYIAAIQPNYPRKIVTEIERLRNYYTAEAYHQHYLEKNPGGYCHIKKEDFQYAGTYTPV